MIFVAYVSAMTFGTVYGFIHGNVNKLLAPVDGNKNFCGINNGKGHDLTKYPYLYFSDFTSASAAFQSGVCVKVCPHDTGNGEIAIECKPGGPADGLCAKAVDAASEHFAYSGSSIGGICLPTSIKAQLPKIRKGLTDIVDRLKHTAGGHFVSDVIAAHVSIYVTMATGFIYAFIFLYLLAEYAVVIAWLSVALSILGCFGGSALCWFMHQDILAERGAPGSG